MNISHDSITAIGALSSEHVDTLHVHWTLLSSCNYHCSYCYQPRVEENCVFVRERIMAMAHSLLESPRPRYIFTFTGGEPTLHPHLPEILSYLQNSGRTVYAKIETNGSRDIAYFKELLRDVQDYTLQFQISVHLAHAELSHILILTAAIAEAQQLAHVRLMFDPEQREAAYSFHEALTRLRGVVPFTANIEPVMQPSDLSKPDPHLTEVDFAWMQEAEAKFASASTTGPVAYPALPFAVSQISCEQSGALQTQEDNRERPFTQLKDFYCCLGTTLVRVDADGCFYGALCNMVPNNPPLWRAKPNAIADAATITRCRNEHCCGGLHAVLPKFRTEEAAQAHMDAMKERAMVHAWEAAPLRNPLNPEPTTEQVVRARLKRMKPGHAQQTECNVCVSKQNLPNFAMRRMEDICTVYKALADDESREAFLRSVKAILTGDAGYIVDAAYDRLTHPQVCEEHGDIHFYQRGRYCTLLQLEATETGSQLHELRGTIRQHQPKLQLALRNDPESYLDAPLWLLENFPGYVLYMGNHASHLDETLLYAFPPVRPARRPAPLPAHIHTPLVSIIVPTHNNEDTLKRCIDSALIQGVDDMEIIIVDDASTDKTPEIIAEYVRRFPKMVRTMRFGENKGAGPARNAGMDMAMGKFMAFIDSDDMLAENFLKRGLEVMEQEGADIVGFDIVLNFHNRKQEELWNVEPGTWAGEESLRKLLLKNAGGYGTYSRLYRSAMLAECNVRYSETRVHQDMFFSVRAFFYSQKTVILPDVGYYRYVRKGSNSANVKGDKYLHSFVDFVSFLTRFFADHNLDTESEMYTYCIKRVYHWDRDRVFAAITQAEKENRLLDLLTEERLLALGESKEALCCILADYATLHCHRNNLHPKVAPKDLDWRAAAAAPRPPKTYTAYGHAENPTTPAPLLSVIVPNYNKEKYLGRCLDSIFSQSMQDFEVIIVDDASTDSSYDMLMDYADMNKSVRLYRMDYNNMQGTCRNMGIEFSRGKYITFIDSDDFAERTFFEYSTSLIERKNVDMIAFSTQDIDDDGNALNVYPCKPLQASGVSACRAYWSSYMPWGPVGKVFNADFIQSNRVVFSEGVYHQDVFFMSNAMLASKAVMTDNTVVYNVVLSRKSSIRPATKNYTHICSIIENFQLSERVFSSCFTRLEQKNCIRGIENVFLPSIGGFYSNSNEIAISNNYLCELSRNSFYMWSLLLGYARCRAKGSIQQGILPSFTQRLTKEYTNTASDAPLVSVIIPTYNQEACISRCLDSVLTQSLRNIEVIVINDASTDKTLDLCEAYAKKDPRVRVYSNERNRGLGYSRNKGTEFAFGKYLSYVDSDDIILRNFLLSATSKLESNNCIDIVHFSYEKTNENMETIEQITCRNEVLNGRQAAVDYLTGRIKTWTVWSKLFRTSYIRKNTISFQPIMHEDEIFLIEAYFHAHSVLLTDEIAYKYIQVKNSASAMNPSKYLPVHVNGLFASSALREQLVSKLFPEYDMETLLKHKNNHAFEPAWRRYSCYIASFEGRANSPLTDDNLRDIKNAPEMFRCLLRGYAKLYALHSNFTPTLPPEDLDPCYSSTVPANYLIPISSHVEDSGQARLSVIIPAYNVAPFLARCLDSVLDQNVDGVEIILVEDCSNKDNTLDICKEYAAKHESIRLFQTPWNSKQGTARNLALQYARGMYVVYADADDYLEEGWLRSALAIMDGNPECEIADFSWCDRNNNDGTFSIKIMPDAVLNGKDALHTYITGKHQNYAMWSKIYLREFLIKNKITCSVTLRNNDESFLVRSYALAKKVVFSSRLAYNYIRFHEFPSAMRPIHYGKAHLESFLFNLRNDHEILTMLANVDENSPIYKYRMKSYICGHRRNNLLYYIHSCNALGLPSPLTDEVLETLTLSKEFMRNLIMDYAVLSQKPLPIKKS